MKFQEQYGNFKHTASGKVREIYTDKYIDCIMLVATDRVSAFDQKLKVEIPDKGKILTAISAEFAHLADDSWGIPVAHLYADVPHLRYINYLDIDAFEGGPSFQNAPELSGRFTIMDNLRMFPAECIVRGYLFGSIWKLYQQGERRICGVDLPNGLVKGSKLKQPIFTPTTKAPEGQRDENITLEEMAKIIEDADLVAEGEGASVAMDIRNRCIELYQKASDYVYEHSDLIIADTKFELGLWHDIISFGDEILTPDSSRFWDAKTFVPGEDPKSFDKQIVRDYLAEAEARGEDITSLPDVIIAKTRQRYIELYSRITGKAWPEE